MILNVLVFFYLIVYMEAGKLTQGKWDYLQLLWLLPFAIYSYLSVHQYYFLQESKLYMIQLMYYLSAFFMTVLLVLSDLKSHTLLHSNAQAFFVLNSLVAMFCQRGIKFRDFTITSTIMTVSWILILYLDSKGDEEELEHAAIHAAGLIAFWALLLVTHHEKEMHKRIEFNRHIILTVESKKNKEVAGKIMPIQALQAMSHEESFVQLIRNGTMLVF